MTKPRLEKVRALFYVLQQVMKRGCAYFDTPAFLFKGYESNQNGYSTNSLKLRPNGSFISK